MEKNRKCLPKVNFARFLLSTALWSFLRTTMGGAHDSALNLDSQHTVATQISVHTHMCALQISVHVFRASKFWREI
jgi:hypothetical protein